MTRDELERELIGTIMTWPMAEAWRLSTYLDQRCKEAGLTLPCGCPLDRVILQPEPGASIMNCKVVNLAHLRPQKPQEAAS